MAPASTATEKKIFFVILYGIWYYGSILVTALVRVLYITAMSAVEIFVYAFIMLFFFPLRKIWPGFYWAMDAWLMRGMMHSIGYWAWSANYRIVEYGDIPFTYLNERCLVVVNHQDSADVPFLVGALCKKGMGAGKIMWILESGFKWTPFGLVSVIRGDCFVEQKAKQFRQYQMKLLAHYTRKRYWSRKRRWFVIFPEGAYLRDLHESDRKFSDAKNLPLLQRVTYPRTGAVKTVLDIANPVVQEPESHSESETVDVSVQAHQSKIADFPPGPGFNFLVDVTIGYESAMPLDFLTVVLGYRRPSEVGILYRRIPIEEVPHGKEEQLRDYLYALWQEKEQKLAFYKDYGHFPGIPIQDGILVDNNIGDMIFYHDGLFVFIAYAVIYQFVPFLIENIDSFAILYTCFWVIFYLMKRPKV